MAQLHTLNVTANFVRDAVTRYSGNFELSEDGRKIRWLGVDNPAQKQHLQALLSHPWDVKDDATCTESPRKRPRLSKLDSSLSNMNTDRQVSHYGTSSSHAYTPIFAHKDSTDSNDSSSGNGDDRSAPDNLSGDGDVGELNLKIRASNNDNGPIIFYKDARFCTDLSGIRRATSKHVAPSYTRSAAVPIGAAIPVTVQTSLDEERGPLTEPHNWTTDSDRETLPASVELHWPQGSTAPTDDTTDTATLIYFDVSGIGGIYPADNFAIDIRTRQLRTKAESEFKGAQNARSKHMLPRKFAALLKQDRAAAPDAVPVVIEDVSANTRHLAASDLPPALAFMPSSYSYDEDDESESGDNELLMPQHDLSTSLPSAAPQSMGFQYAASSEADLDGDNDSEVDSDGSLDLLAAAREVDPDAIRAREREYDAIMAERLAEEIPAGSSAATAGGGSGFTSPVEGLTAQQYGEAKRALQASALAGSRIHRSTHVEQATEDERLQAPNAAQSPRTLEARPYTGSEGEVDDDASHDANSQSWRSIGS